ncbi:MAG TPA: hypothetical protein VGK73_19290, partial [Polyangiaceae bacterium]
MLAQLTRHPRLTLGQKRPGLAALVGGVLLLCLAWPSPARADQLTDPRTDYTAYTRAQGEVAAGLFKVELGVIDEVMVGTYVPTWFAFPFLSVPIPTAYVKARSWWDGPLTLALRGGVAYFNAKALAHIADQDVSASVLSTSSELDLSYQIHQRFTLTLGVDLSTIHAVGSGDDAATSIEGASTANTYSMRLFGEWRLTRVFALTLLTRVLLYQSPYGADSEAENDEVTVTTDLS